MERLRDISLDAYDRLVGLELGDLAVDGCVTKAPCGGEKAGRNPVDRGKGGIKRSTAVDASGIPVGTVTAPANRHDSPLLGATLDAVAESLGGLPERASVHLDRGYDSDATRERLHKSAGCSPRSPRRVSRPRFRPRNGGLWRGLTRGTTPTKSLCGVPRGEGGSIGLLGRLLRGGHRCETAHPKSLDPLPLGGTTSAQTMTYWRKL